MRTRSGGPDAALVSFIPVRSDVDDVRARTGIRRTIMKIGGPYDAENGVENTRRNSARGLYIREGRLFLILRAKPPGLLRGESGRVSSSSAGVTTVVYTRCPTWCVLYIARDTFRPNSVLVPYVHLILLLYASLFTRRACEKSFAVLTCATTAIVSHVLCC